MFRARSTILALAILPILAASPRAQDPPAMDPNAAPAPARTGVVERGGVTLILLDVEVTDRKGRPIRGLTKDDFSLKLDSRIWPIYSVDDFCGCPGGETETAERAGGESPGGSASAKRPPAPAGARAAEPVHIILYLDFSQLQQAGAVRATRAAESWIREQVRPGDRAQLVAYADRPGLRELTGFTDEPEVLLKALREAVEGGEFRDVFPNEFQIRIGECVSCIEQCEESRAKCGPLPCIDCCSICDNNVTAEYRHGARSLRAMEILMARLEDVPGRKAVIVFHQNGVPDPVVFYPYGPNTVAAPVGDHYTQMEELGATANAARVSLYPIQTGDSLTSGLADEAVTTGLDLADFTGGRYSRSLADIGDVMAGVGRGCSCIYRLGFEPPDVDETKVYAAHIKAAGRLVKNSFRVIHLNEPDRLMRKAQRVLANPASARDLDMSVALVPSSLSGRKWSATVQVAIEIRSLDLLPLAEGQAGRLDVGALLRNVENGKSWEMLAGAEVRKSGSGGSDGVLVYEHPLEDLPAGSYAVSAFARNKDLDIYGGAEATIELPEPKGDGFAGPIAFTAGRTVYVSDLPLREKAAPPGAAARRLVPGTRAVPAGEHEIPRGRLLEFVSWLCGEEAGSSPESFKTFVARDDVPVFRLPPPGVQSIGGCVRRTDLVDTGSLEPGRYTYRRVSAAGEEEPFEFDAVPFVVIETPAPAQETAP